MLGPEWAIVATTIAGLGSRNDLFTMGAPMKLTAKQLRFVAEYIKCLNGTQAAIAAGYSPKTARAIASENLTKPAVQAEIARQEQIRQAHLYKEQDFVVQQLVKIVDFDIGRIYDDKNQIPPPYKWPTDALGVITSFESKPGRGVPRQLRYSVQLIDRIKALERIGEIVGAFKRRRNVKRKKSA